MGMNIDKIKEAIGNKNIPSELQSELEEPQIKPYESINGYRLIINKEIKEPKIKPYESKIEQIEKEFKDMEVNTVKACGYDANCVSKKLLITETKALKLVSKILFDEGLSK